MKSTLSVSSRGQITLPSSLRKKMGIENGGIVKVEEQNGKLVLSPATIVSTRMYTDEEIKQWLADDEPQPGDGEKIQNIIKRFPKS